MIIVPNGALSNGIINNFSSTVVRRVDWKIELSYGDDVHKAKELILNMFNFCLTSTRCTSKIKLNILLS